MPKPFPTSVRMPPELREKVVAICNKRGCSISFLVVEVLRKWLGQEGKDAA
jgi:predicted DNA-binding protein